MSLHEHHRVQRTGWLRAAVLGANDGIVSTASLIIGVAAANVPKESILLAGVAGLVAGAMSMAAGEYVSVSSQADTEQADLDIEQQSLDRNYDLEVDELATIYIQRGVEQQLAGKLAEQLMAHDALAAHARDEIGISDKVTARPLQAAWSSGVAFTAGASLPLLTAWAVPASTLMASVALASLLSLAALGMLAALVGGASVARGALRVTFWGALAMAVTAGVGTSFGAVA